MTRWRPPHPDPDEPIFITCGPDGESLRCRICGAVDQVFQDQMPSVAGYGEDTYAAAPATLLALTAWRHGQGALAAVAVDRALAADPNYRLARLIDHALRHGIPPTALHDTPATDDPTP